MTREHTHPEKSDVDVSVAQEPFVSEDVTIPASLEDAAPAAAPTLEGLVEGEAQPPAEESAAAAPGYELPQQTETPHALQVKESAATYELPPASIAVEQERMATAEPAPLVEETFLPFEAAEVRPFSEFIEEFRQAEEARQAVTLEVVYEALDALAAPAATEAEEKQEEAALPEPAIPAPGRLSFVTPTAVIPAVEEEPAAAATSAAEESESADEPASAAEPPVPSSPPPPEKPVERPVSPLLRPATRIRLPRYGRLREPLIEEQPPQEPERTAAPSVDLPAPAAETEAPVEEQSAPRPARRYRFDRPAASSSAMFLVNPPQPAAPEQNREAVERTSSESAARAAAEESARAAATLPAAEPETPRAITAAEPVAEPPVQERRKHAREKQREKEKEREKEQPAVPAAAAPAPAPTPAPALAPQPTTNGAKPSAQEAAPSVPEELPPLEYAEIQAATSRRRRRRRSKASASEPPSPIAPSPTPVPPVAVPPITSPVMPSVTPPAAAAGPYNIISGYTVNQMNLGSEFGGPFMAPEPSPARGSVVMREAGVRPSRSDVQRNTVIYPGRSSSDPMSQFANSVVQAIQSQTNRIVAELRRSNQAPTNVSVSIPPLPSTERVGVFVDVANLLYSARTLRLTIDFGKLLDFLRGNRRLVRAHAYCPTSPQPGDEQMFLQAVKGLGYRITTKNYKTFSSGAKKADLDLDLCMDVVRLVESHAVDCIVLVSGDSDFMPMLDYCSDHGVRVEVAAFDEAMSATLRQSCDLFINLSMLEEIRA